MAAVIREIPYYILDILMEYSDRDHVLSIGRIQKMASDRSGTAVGRRAVTGSIEMLRSLGFDIVFVKDAMKQGYYLADGGRLFDFGDVIMLAHEVHSSHFIPADHSEHLIQKLLSTRSIYERNQFREDVFLPNEFKTGNVNLKSNFISVYSAIKNRRVIQFCYLQYEYDCIQHKKDNGRIYTAAPRVLLEHDSRPYVLATNRDSDDFITYRLDRMIDVTLEDEKFLPLTLEAEQDAYSVTRNKLFMFSGEDINATLRCRRRILDTMLDLFGTGVKIINHTAEYFDLRVKAPERGLVLLAQQYLDVLYITDPEDLREKMREILREAMKNYQD